MNIKNMNVKKNTARDTAICEDPALNKGAGFTLLCQVNNTFKIVSRNRDIEYIDFNQLKKDTEENLITNAEIRDGKIHTVNMYKAIKNDQFEESIQKQYNRYEALSTVLGSKMSFEYNIEGEEVKLVKYTGSNKNVIVPKFITSIIKEAFYDTEIEAITLEPGLKSIGSHAFDGCNLTEIVIPESVEFIGVWTFNGNMRLIKKEGGYKKDKITILNKNAVIMDRYNNKLY